MQNLIRPFITRLGLWIGFWLTLFGCMSFTSFAIQNTIDERWSWTNGMVRPDQVESVDWYGGRNLEELRKQFSGNERLITYRLDLEALSCTSCVLSPGLIIQDYEIYVNGILQQRHGSLEKDAISPRGKSSFHLHLPSDQPVQILFIVKAYQDLVGLYGPLMIGEEREVTGIQAQQSISYLVAAIVMGFSALLNWMIFYPLRKENVYLYFGFACLTGSLYLFSKTPLIQLFAGTTFDMESIEMLSLFALPFLSWLYFVEIMGKNVRWHQTISILLGAFVSYALLEAWFLHETMRHLLLTGQYIMLFTFVLIAALTLLGLKHAQPLTTGFAVSLLISIALVLTSLVVSMYTTLQIDIFPWIGFAFVTAQVYLLANRARDLNRTLINQTVELQNKNDDLIRLSKMKDEFLANTSHELRTPLTGIIGLTEHMLQPSSQPLPDKTKEHLHLIHCSSKRLSVLINDILDFSQIRAKGLALQPARINTRDALQQVIDILSPLLKSSRVKFEMNIGDDAPPLWADANRVQQMLHNLIGNAIKFTHEGFVRIEITSDEQFVNIHILDSGIGMSEDQLKRIFEPFEQANEKIGKSYGGTGLGLAVTRQLAELHGGTIEVYSQIDQGSEFILRLPLAVEQVAHNRNASPISLEPAVQIQKR